MGQSTHTIKCYCKNIEVMEDIVRYEYLPTFRKIVMPSSSESIGMKTVDMLGPGDEGASIPRRVCLSVCNILPTDTA